MIQLLYFFELKLKLIQKFLDLIRSGAYWQSAQDDCLLFSLSLCVTLGSLAFRVA